MAGQAGRPPAPAAAAAHQRPQTPALVIDRFLPRYDFAVAHAGVFRDPPDVCYRTARHLDLLQDPVIRLLMGIRGLPERVGRRRAGPRDPDTAGPAPTFRLEDMASVGWVLLGEDPGAEIVLGQIGRPWKPADTPAASLVAPGEFADFSTPGYAKIAFSLRVHPYGAGSSIVTMETRAALTDPGSRRRFKRYWLVIAPFSDLIRRIALRLLAAELRRARGSSPAHPAASPAPSQD
jgi:hypothetical protein